MVVLNHTLVWVRDKREASAFFSEVLGLPEPQPLDVFMEIKGSPDVALDFIDTDSVIAPQHYAFLVSESEFDEILGRVRERELTFWADAAHHRPGLINTWDGGRGVYFDDPNGHLLEIITRPYGADWLAGGGEERYVAP